MSLKDWLEMSSIDRVLIVRALNKLNQKRDALSEAMNAPPHKQHR